MWLLHRSNLNYIIFSYILLSVTSERCSSARLCARTRTLRRLQLWRVVGNVREIRSARDLNLILPAQDADVLSFLTSDW